MPQDIEAIDPGYIEVEEQEPWRGRSTWSTVRALFVEIVETRFPVGDDIERVSDAMHPPGTLRRENVVLVVFGHEND
jgi:hypothetical protein